MTGRQRRRVITGSIGAALVVLLLGWGIAWAGGPPFERTAEEVCNMTFSEGDGYAIDLSLSPPGSRRCVVMNVDGDRHTAVYIPWLEWLTSLLLAAGVGLGVAALITVGPRLALAFGSAALTVAALAAWFMGLVPALLFVAASVALAIVLQVARVARRSGASDSPAH